MLPNDGRLQATRKSVRLDEFGSRAAVGAELDRPAEKRPNPVGVDAP
jgi:hypothetical protein